MNQSADNGTKAGIIGGTLLSVFFNIHTEDLIKTALLAATGAVVSFIVSLSLKWLAKKRK